MDKILGKVVGGLMVVTGLVFLFGRSEKEVKQVEGKVIPTEPKTPPAIPVPNLPAVAVQEEKKPAVQEEKKPAAEVKAAE